MPANSNNPTQEACYEAGGGLIYIGITPASHRGHYAMTPERGPCAFTDPRTLLRWALGMGEPCFGLGTSAAGARLAAWLHDRGYCVRWLPVAEGQGVERARHMAADLARGAGLPYHARQAARMLASASHLRQQAVELWARADRMAGQAWGLALP